MYSMSAYTVLKVNGTGRAVQCKSSCISSLVELDAPGPSLCRPQLIVAPIGTLRYSFLTAQRGLMNP